MHQKNNSKKRKKPFKPNKFVRFTSAGLQIGVTIWLGNEIGKWLDTRYNKTFFESTVTLFSVFVAIYLVIVQVMKISKEND